MNKQQLTTDQAFSLALEHHLAERYAEAETIYRQIVIAEPDHVDAQNNRGDALRKLGRLNDAIASFRRAITINPESADLHYNLGIALDEKGLYHDAEASYRRCIDLDPGFALAHYGLGGIEMEMTRLPEAVQSYRRAVEIDPSFPDAHFNLGLAFQEQGNYEDAVESYGKALAIDPAQVGAQANTGFALKKLLRLDEALEAYGRAVEMSPNNGKVLANMGDVYLVQGNPQAAVDLCNAFLDNRPGNISVLAFKAAALNELGNDDELRALHDFDRLVRPVSPAAPNGFTNMASFNAALAEHVLAHPTLVKGAASYSTMNGRHSAELLEEPKGPMSAFEDFVMDAVAGYRDAVPLDPDHPFLAQRPEKMTLTAWAVVMDTQGYQVCHIHPTGWLSGVYYPKLPKVIADDDPDQAGWIEFGRTADNFHGTREQEVRRYKPVEGLMVLFPSYFYHRTIPFESDEFRISIAFDVRPDD